MLKKLFNRFTLLRVHLRLNPPYNRVLDRKIISLLPHEVFVFGSNTRGIHTGGAAATAHARFDAQMGFSAGHIGKCYAIPTLGHDFFRLPKDLVQYYVTKFIEAAELNPHKLYLVTEIGCGIAGFDVKDIAPMFTEAIKVKNIALPKRFWDELI